MKNDDNVTQLLVRLSSGDSRAMQEILPQIYDELRRLAGHYFRGEKSEHTLQPTALVHEAFLRLIQIDSVTWEHRAHFMGAAAGVMRRVLIDHARAKNAEKRGGPGKKIEFSDELHGEGHEIETMLEIDDALTKLGDQDPRLAKIVELRYFAGMEWKEVAAATGVSEATVKRDWALAKAWLERELA